MVNNSQKAFAAGAAPAPRIGGVGRRSDFSSILRGAVDFLLQVALTRQESMPPQEKVDEAKEYYEHLDDDNSPLVPGYARIEPYFYTGEPDEYDRDTGEWTDPVLRRRRGRFEILLDHVSSLGDLLYSTSAIGDARESLSAAELSALDAAPHSARQRRLFIRLRRTWNPEEEEFWPALHDHWESTLINLKQKAAEFAASGGLHALTRFQHAYAIVLTATIKLNMDYFTLSVRAWLERQMRFWRDMAELSAASAGTEVFAMIGGPATVRQSEAAAKALLLLGDPGDIAAVMLKAEETGEMIATRKRSAGGAVPLTDADSAFIAGLLDGFHDDFARRALLGSPSEEAGGTVAARAMAALAKALPARGGEAAVDSAAMLYGLRETAPQVVRAFLASFNASGVVSLEAKAAKQKIAPENWERAKAHPIAAFLDFAGNVANADRLVFASGDDAPEVVAYAASIAEQAFRQVLGELRRGGLDEAAAGERYAALIADPEEPMTRQAHKAGKAAAFKPVPAAALKAAAELEERLPWLGILLPLVSGAEGILAAARERPVQAAIADRYAEALRGDDEGRKYMALVRLGYGLLVAMALLQLAAKGRLGLGEDGSAAITAGPLVQKLPAGAGPTELAAMAVRLSPRLDAPLAGDALDAAEQAVAGLLLLAAESFAGEEEPLLDLIVELAGEHEDEVLEERFAGFADTYATPPAPSAPLAPLRRDTARLIAGLAAD